MLLKEFHCGNALGEDDDALLGILLPNLQKLGPECLVSGVDAFRNVVVDKLQQFLHLHAVVLLATLLQRGLGGIGRREITLEQRQGKERVGAVGLADRLETGVLHLEEPLFLRMQTDGDADDPAVLELTTDALVLNILLEATHIVGAYIFLSVLATTRDRDGVEHAHEIGKRLGIAIVRCGRGKDEGVALLGKELSQVATQTRVVGHLVTLVDDDDVPVGFLQPCTESAVVLERIDRDNGLVVIVERILVERYLVLNPCHADAV